MTLLAQFQPQSLTPLQLMLPQMICFAFQPAPNGTENLGDFQKYQDELQKLEQQLQISNDRTEELSSMNQALRDKLANLTQEGRDIHDKMLNFHRNATLEKQKLQEKKAQLQQETNNPRIALLDQILNLKEYKDQCLLVLGEISQHKDNVLQDITVKNASTEAATQKTNNLESELNQKQLQINTTKAQIQQLKKEIQVKMNVASLPSNRRKVYQVTTTPKPTAQNPQDVLEQEIKKEVQKKSKADKLQLVSEAAATGNLTLLKALVGLGVDVSSPDNFGFQPLDWAALSGDVEVTKALIAAGGDVSKHTNDGDTPLHLAARKGQLEVVKLLLDAGADPSAQNDDLSTPLHEAAYYGFQDICRLLLQKGAYVNQENSQKNTAVHFAARSGHLEVVQLLEEHGADLWSVNADGKTPQQEAQEARKRDVVEWIVSQ